MRNTLEIDGHIAVISFDPEIEMFSGEFIDLNGGADFYAHSVEELKKEGSISLSVFLRECKKSGIVPYKSYSGRITGRLTPELHQALTITAQTTGYSVNELLNEGADLVRQKYA